MEIQDRSLLSSNILVEAQCSTASHESLLLEIDPTQEGASLGSKISQPMFFPALFFADLSQSLFRRTQFFSSAKNFLGPFERGEAQPLVCNSVNVSGSGSFGDVYLGSSSSAIMTISNPQGCPVTFSVAGAPYGFSLSSSGGTIPSKGTTSITITFRPSYEQSYSGSVSVTPGGGGLFLSGRGIAPRKD